MDIFINDFAIATRLGMGRLETEGNLRSHEPPVPDSPQRLTNGQTTVAAALPAPLQASLPGLTRTNRIIAQMLSQIQATCDGILSRYPADRIGVVLGTSTTGIEDALGPLRKRLETAHWEKGFNFANQELGDTSSFLKEQLGVKGMSYTVSTACTSGMKSIISAARMIRTGVADAVVCGGADSLAQLTLNGFNALDAVSPSRCVPFSANRNGINIGEGGALFIVSREPGPWRLAAWAETSDAYHISSPDPEGTSAERAARLTLQEAGIGVSDVGFVHMHGTATRLNDSMEATLVNRVFGPEKPAVSTKGMTGHTLGAAGAVQLAINLIAMDAGVYPPHIYDGEWDNELPRLRLTQRQEVAERPVEYALACCYAFGGSNAAILAARG